MRALLTAQHLLLTSFSWGSQTANSAKKQTHLSQRRTLIEHLSALQDELNNGKSGLLLSERPLVTLSSNRRLELLCCNSERPLQVCEFQVLGRRRGQEASEALLDGLDLRNIQVDGSDCASLLRFCGKKKALSDGKQAHAHIIKSGLEELATLGNLLIYMYGNCGALEDACEVFSKLHIKDNFSWNFIIKAYARQSQCKDALRLFEEMLLAGMAPDRFIFISVFSSFASKENLARGRLMHARIANSCLESDVAVCTALISMYGKCGSLEGASTVFNQMQQQDTVPWNSMIGTFIQFEQGKNSLQLFQQMLQEVVLPDRVTFLSILSACADKDTLAEGKWIHARIISCGFHADLAIGTALVNMYSNCNSLEDACNSFDSMSEHDVVSWNAMIAAYTQHRQTREGFELFEEMQCQGVVPDRVTFLTLLDACASQAVPIDETWIQLNIKETAMDSDVDVWAAVVNMYSKCGHVRCAWKIFKSLAKRNVGTWNAIIVGFVQNGQLNKALQLLEDMHQDGVVPDKFTFITLFDACGSQAAFLEGKSLHASISGSALEFDDIIRTSLLNMYGKCSRLDEAREVFYEADERNVVLWNVMIAVYVGNGHCKEALQSFEQMYIEGFVPNEVTFLCVLDMCAIQGACDEGKRAHCRIHGSGYQSNVVLGTSLLNMYSKCGFMTEAQRMFADLSEKDRISWTVMISGYAQHGQDKDALTFFNRMQEEGVIPDKVTFASILPALANQMTFVKGKHMHACITGSRFELDAFIGTGLVSMYSKCGRMREAWRIFSKMLDRNLISWNALIVGYTQSNYAKEALKLFDRMLHEAVMLDNVTLASIFYACSSLANLTKGYQIHAGISGSGLEFDDIVGAALVNMYAKCGSLGYAQHIFDTMAARNIISWTTIIAAYAQHGNGKDALQLFDKMQQEGVVPNEVTFISILSACSHAGLVDEGKYIFEFMNLRNGVLPDVDHYHCMIDLFGRAGRLDDAESLILGMPHEATYFSWMALLGACRNRLDVERGERAALQLFHLDSENPEPYVSLSNIYAAAGMEDKVVGNHDRASKKQKFSGWSKGCTVSFSKN